MAKKSKTPQLGISAIFAQHGIAMSESLEKLWGEPKIIATDVAIESLRASTTYKDSYYCIVRDGDVSRLVSFPSGDIDEDEFAFDGDIATNPPASVNIGILTAIRDDDDLQVRDLQDELVDVVEGTEVLRAYL